MKRGSVLQTNHSYDHVIDERDVFGKYVLELGQFMQPIKLGPKLALNTFCKQGMEQTFRNPGDHREHKNLVAQES